MSATRLYRCAVCGEHVAACYLCPDCGQVACTLECLRGHQDQKHAPVHRRPTAAENRAVQVLPVPRFSG
jgi:hypothetical protein